MRAYPSRAVLLVCVVFQAAFASAVAQDCVTRKPLYWFTHAEGPDTNCACLLQVIEANGGRLDLGFACLPVRNIGDTNALAQALGCYWKHRWVLAPHPAAHHLRRARTLLAPQLIAAIANQVLFGASPGFCTDPATGANFPVTLISDAQAAAACDDVAAITNVTATLERFNRSGNTNDLPIPLIECPPDDRVDRRIARDWVTHWMWNGTNYCASGRACP